MKRSLKRRGLSARIICHKRRYKLRLREYRYIYRKSLNLRVVISIEKGGIQGRSR